MTDTPDKKTVRREKAKARAAKVKHVTKKQMRRASFSKQMAGFVDFIRKQGIIGLAIGLAIGTQASALVNAIVASMITPIVNLIVGPGGLEGLTWTVEIGKRSGTFNFGMLINAIINFMAVALVVYFVIMGLGLDKLDKKKDA